MRAALDAQMQKYCNYLTFGPFERSNLNQWGMGTLQLTHNTLGHLPIIHGHL